MQIHSNREQTNSSRRVAVIGSGISGLAAAWLLTSKLDVTLYESEARLGGHSNTVIVPTANGDLPVDTGFIVYNERNYPNLVALFRDIGVPTAASNMSFAASLEGGKLEYSGSGLNGLIGQRGNVIRPRFWRMMRDILRFYREAPGLLGRADLSGVSLGDYLDRNDYAPAFVEDHLLPMGAAIWSTTARDMRAYPLLAFVRFFASHGLLSLADRPKWRTVLGGSREYVRSMSAGLEGKIRLGTAVRSVTRDNGRVIVTDAAGHADSFTDVVIATHANQALAMLADADLQERALLGAFRYSCATGCFRCCSISTKRLLKAHRFPRPAPAGARLIDRALAGPLLRYPLMTLKVALGINWEAQRIWWKGFHVHRYNDAASKHATTIIAGTISGHAHS